MASFFDLPLEIIMQIIAALQDDLADLEAISQTCHSLRPLCRPFIFRSVEFTSRHSYRNSSDLAKSFGCLLDQNPEISAYVRILVCQIYPQDLEHDDIPRILMRFRRVRSFRFWGGQVHWKALLQPWRESLSHIIHLPTIESLEISYCKAFPIALFSPCLNLTSLTVLYINLDAMAGAEEESSVPDHDIAPQLRSFTFGVRAGHYAQKLFAARCPNGLPLLNFKNLRVLSVHVNRYESDLPIVHALLKAAEKLETLQFIVDTWTEGFEGFAASINPSSLSTLKCLRLEYDLDDDVQDPLYGIGAELEALSGINRFEEINLRVRVQTDHSCNAGDQWAALDAVLATGFPMLRQVSLHIVIAVYSRRQMAIALQEKLQRLPGKQLLRLSTSSVVQFDFSTKIELV